jgi:hypothetical protein
MIVEAVGGKAFLPPIVVAVRLVEVVALGDGDAFVAIDAGILVAVMDDGMTARLQHLAQLHDLLREGAG